MDVIVSRATKPRLGVYSRSLRRGVLGEGVDGRSREGRFLRRVEADLVAHVGGSPSFTQRLLIRRAARAMLQLELLDEKMTGGDGFTDHDGRVFGGLSNSLRLMLRELGLKAPPPKVANPLVEHFSRPVAREARP